MYKQVNLSRKGLSYMSIIGLITLFVLIFVALVISFLFLISGKSNMFSSDLETTIEVFSANPDFIAENPIVNLSEKDITLTVKRINGEDSNIGFQLILEDGNNNAEIVRLNNSIKSNGEEKIISFSYTKLKKVKYITLIPLKTDSQGKEVSYSPSISWH